MMDKFKLLATFGFVVGLLALASLIAYGVTGLHWWAEVGRYDTGRAFVLIFLHIFSVIGGLFSFIYLFLEWEPE